MSFWSSLVSIVAKVSPVIGMLLGGPAGAKVGSWIASLLGVDNNPDAVLKAIKDNPEALLKIKELELSHQAEIERIITEGDTAQLTEVNTTMRAELASNDRFKSSWRPLFGYIVAITWGIQSIGIFIAVIYCTFHTSAFNLLNLLANLEQATATSWMIALAVLGVNINQRTKEKLLGNGIKPVGVIDKVIGAMKK